MKSGRQYQCFSPLISVTLVCALVHAAGGAAAAQQLGPEADGQIAAFVQWHEQNVRPLEIAVNLAWWKANTSGRDADFQAKIEAENRLNEILSSRERFAQLKTLQAANVTNSMLRRQLQMLYLMYLSRQVDSQLMQRMTAQANAMEQAFNVFRATVDQQPMTDSQVRQVLWESTDSQYRRSVWEASKAVGAVVQRDLRQLVHWRNEAARQLEFDNYHTMQLQLNEQDPRQVLQLFDELDQLTRQPYREIKAEIDQRLAALYQVGVDELRPWHYHDPFFQESPNVFEVDLDSAFADVDIAAICVRFYSGIDLPVRSVIEQSDLYERAGKSPHAFCTDIDREGDVRVLANIVPNEYWMATMLHELGHAVYSSKFIPGSVPYVLRKDAHILTTEGLAMMFERLSSSSQWLEMMGIELADPQAYERAAKQKRRNKLLIFSRWCQVMFRFEMRMYADPDQDLNRLWWDLVEEYQLVRRPEGRDAADYASKIHIVTAPAYYHNYMMGELFACQLHAAIAREVLGEPDPRTAIYFNDPQVGIFLKRKVLSQGALRDWNSLTRFATGEPLRATAFAAELAR